MAYSAQEKNLILEKLEPYFKLGLKLNGAVNAYNAEHPKEYLFRRTIQNWLDDDEILKDTVEAWKAHPNILARRSWLYHIDKQSSLSNYAASKDWLERREKDEFSTRKEFTGKDGESLKPLTAEQEAKLNSIAYKPNEPTSTNGAIYETEIKQG
jgi:hypothetical protein